MFGNVRVVMKDGIPYFVGKDVASCLGYVDTVKALKQHCKGVVKCPILTKGGKQNMIILLEGDLYRLVLVTPQSSLDDTICHSLSNIT